MRTKYTFNDDTYTPLPVHIRVQSRNGRNYISSISGLNPDIDFKKLCKYLKKKFKCNGAVTEDKVYGKVILLQGDRRESIKHFLDDNDICMGKIIVHGFLNIV